jgi:hypothetical protein
MDKERFLARCCFSIYSFNVSFSTNENKCLNHQSLSLCTIIKSEMVLTCMHHFQLKIVQVHHHFCLSSVILLHTLHLFQRIPQFGFNRDYASVSIERASIWLMITCKHWNASANEISRWIWHVHLFLFLWTNIKDHFGNQETQISNMFSFEMLPFYTVVKTKLPSASFKQVMIPTLTKLK